MTDQDPQASGVDPEAAEFQENLQTDGVYLKLKSQVEHLQTTVDSQKAVIENIDKTSELALEALKDENERLKKRLQRDWYIPQVAFGVVVTLAGLLFGFNFIDHTWTTSRLEKTSTELHDSINANQEKVIAAIADLESFKTEHQGLITNSGNVVSKSANLIDASIDANAAASRVLAVCSIARDQLANKDDAVSASYYAAEADRELREALTKLGKDAESSQEIRSMLERLQSSVWTLQAECALRRREFDKVLQLSSLITNSDCDCLEGNYFQGIAQLALAVQVGRSETDRTALIVAAVQALKASEVGNNTIVPGVVADIFLGGAELELGHDEASWEALDRFLRTSPGTEEEIARLRGRSKAQIALATAFRNIAAFRLGKDNRLLMEDFVCDLGASGIGPVEGVILERILEKAIDVRVPNERNLNLSEADWARYQTYLAQVAAAIQMACSGETSSGDPLTCASCGPDYVHPLVAGHHIIKMPTKSYGDGAGFVLNDGSIELTEYLIVLETRTRAVIENGATREEQYVVRVPLQRIITVPPGEPVPFSYYDHSTDAEAGMAAPVPEGDFFDAPAAPGDIEESPAPPAAADIVPAPTISDADSAA